MTTPHPCRARRPVLAALLAAVLWTAPSAALAQEPTPNQTLDPNQATVTGRAELRTGHVDIGPRLVQGQWQIQIHDDSLVPPVWRRPDDVVLRVGQSALQQVPDGPAYAFLGQAPGTDVYVVPQTQNLDVVWVGWNTQDPATMKAISRGVTVNVTGVQGPGSMTVFLQSGTLGAPEVLWDSRKPYPQKLWVETNTHTHANWVFSTAGVYLVRLEMAAELLDGTDARTSAVIRYAVGDTTSAEQAYTATMSAPEPADGSPPPAPDRPVDLPASGSSLLLPATVAFAVLLLAVLGWLLVRDARHRRQRRDSTPEQETSV